MTRYGGENNRRERLIKVRDMERKKNKKIKKKTKKETNKKDKILFIFPTKYLETLICSTV